MIEQEKPRTRERKHHVEPCGYGDSDDDALSCAVQMPLSYADDGDDALS